MLLTRESDYAIRVVRALKDESKRTVKEICQEEEIPEPFTYKILKKLEKAEIVKSIRGAHGGYMLKKPLNDLSLLDVVLAIDSDFAITQCTKASAQCSRNEDENPYGIRAEFERVQNVIIEEFRQRKLSDFIQ